MAPKEVVDAEIGPGGIGGQRVFRAFQVGAHGVDGARLAVGGDIALHGGHPVAKEHVDVACGQRGIGHRHRQHLDLGVIAKRLKHTVVVAVVAVMSVQPTSEKVTVSQSASAGAVAAASDGGDGRVVLRVMSRSLPFFYVGRCPFGKGRRDGPRRAPVMSNGF